MAESDYSEKFVCRNGKPVTIKIDEDSYEVEVFDSDNQKIGGMNFSEQDSGNKSVLKLTWAYLDGLDGKYVHQGIGRQILEVINKRYGMSIVAEDDDGIQKDDGSHLTGNAPVFVARMREEGLIAHSIQSMPDDKDIDW